MNATAWAVVKMPGASREAVSGAIGQARLAAARSPDDARIENTLG
jgi:hypothetical protein